jgi:glycosyltransferase involved in cell wall biosynthesis
MQLVAVPPAGGVALSQKLGVLRVGPRYVGTILRQLRGSDIVHVRCPSNIGLIAMLILALRAAPRRRWIKYAGNWRPMGRESWSYGLQRWLLYRGIPSALVTVNGEWPGQPAHVRSFLNPCLTEEELREGAALGAGKQLDAPLRLLFVGRLEEDKGCGRAIEVLARLKRRGVAVRLDLVGDGPDRLRFERQAAAEGVADDVRFLGWMPRPQLGRLYAQAHVFLFPSRCSEGWPKVLSEAMAYGVVPVAGDVSSIPQYLEGFRAGRALDLADREGFVSAITEYVKDRARWKTESRNAMEAAQRFSYARYLAAVRNLLFPEAA